MVTLRLPGAPGLEEKADTCWRCLCNPKPDVIRKYYSSVPKSQEKRQFAIPQDPESFQEAQTPWLEDSKKGLQVCRSGSPPLPPCRAVEEQEGKAYCERAAALLGEQVQRS